MSGKRKRNQLSSSSPNSCLLVQADSHSLVGGAAFGDTSFDEEKSGGRQFPHLLLSHQLPLQFRFSMKKSASVEGDLDGLMSANFDSCCNLATPDVSAYAKWLAHEAPSVYVCLGFAYAVLAGMCFTAANVVVKFAGDLDAWQLLFVRCVVQVAAMLPLMGCTRSSPFGRGSAGVSVVATRWKLFVLCLLGALLLLGRFLAVRRLPLGDATALFSTAPGVTLLFSALFLGDRCGVFRLTLAASLLGGVILLSQPPALFPEVAPAPLALNGTNVETATAPYDLLGAGAAVLVPLITSLTVILLRQTRQVPCSVLVFWLGLGGLALSLIGMFAINFNINSNNDDLERDLFGGWGAREWVLALLVALLGVAGSVLMTQALHLVSPARLMVLKSLDVLAAYLLQVIFISTSSNLT